MNIAVIVVFTFRIKCNRKRIVLAKQAGCELVVGKLGLLHAPGFPPGDGNTAGDIVINGIEIDPPDRRACSDCRLRWYELEVLDFDGNG